MMLWGIDVAPITGAIVFAISMMSVCLGMAISIMFIRAAIFVETQKAGEKKEKNNE